MQSLIFRHAGVAWCNSIVFEFVEMSFEHWMPNFAECWCVMGAVADTGTGTDTDTDTDIDTEMEGRGKGEREGCEVRSPSFPPSLPPPHPRPFPLILIPVV